MKKLLAAALGVSLFCLPLLAACGDGGNGVDPADYGYGPSLDGVAIEGDWSFSENGISSEGTSGKSSIYKTGTKTDYAFSFTAKLVESGSGAAFGGYAYYKDSTNYVEFMVDPAANTMTVVSVKGYDRQPIVASLAEETDFADASGVSSVKVGNEFRFYVEDTLITTVQETFDGAGQVGFMTDSAKVEFGGVAVSDATGFAESGILNEVYTPAVGTPGTWEIDGSSAARTDTDPTTANIESVVFNSAVASNYSFKATAKLTQTTEGGYGYYGIVAYYQNANNYAIVFFNGGYVDVLTMYDANYWWSGGIEIPNAPEDGVHTVEGAKIGDTIRVYVNDTFIREISYPSFARPGSVGFDTNGACAEFEIRELKSVNSYEDDRYAQTVHVNYPHLLSFENGVYTTVPDPAIEGGLPDGTNYGGIVQAFDVSIRAEFEYEIELSTANLTADAANATGIIGVGGYGANNASYIAMMIDSSGNADLFGNYTDMDENSVVNTWAGQKKKLPDAAFEEGGALKEKLVFAASYDGQTLRFFIEGTEMYSVEPAGCILAKPGFLANYVGASFTVK